jgi:hypothetical protein
MNRWNVIAGILLLLSMSGLPVVAAEGVLVLELRPQVTVSKHIVTLDDVAIISGATAR